MTRDDTGYRSDTRHGGYQYLIWYVQESEWREDRCQVANDTQVKVIVGHAWLASQAQTDQDIGRHVAQPGAFDWLPLCRYVTATMAARKGKPMRSSPTQSGKLVRVLWDKRGSPTRHVSDVLRIERWQLRQAIHKIKARSNLGGIDKVIIYSDGKVADVHGGEVGNIFDEI